MTEEFRHSYSRMWLAVINADVKQMKIWGQALGVGELFPLLACIMTAKPWNAIERGLNKVVDKETKQKEVILECFSIKAKELLLSLIDSLENCENMRQCICKRYLTCCPKLTDRCF